MLLETDAPDGLPKLDPSSLMWIPGDANAPVEGSDDIKDKNLTSQALNHPANIKSVCF